MSNAVFYLPDSAASFCSLEDERNLEVLLPLDHQMLVCRHYKVFLVFFLDLLGAKPVRSGHKAMGFYLSLGHL